MQLNIDTLTKRLFCVIALMVLCLSASYADDLKPEALYQKVLPSVMTLIVEDKDGTGATGTGFLVLGDGIAATAWHVVDGAKHVIAKFADGEVYDVLGLIDKDELHDIALIRVKERERPRLTLVTTEPAIGSRAYVIGAPEGLEFSVSDGLISQIQHIDNLKYFQFTCASSPGNSGGPLTNARGEVLGVVDRQFGEGQNLNFAIPSSYIGGLNATLPMQPWDKVGSSVPVAPKAEVVENGTLDKYLADGYVSVIDMQTVFAFMETTMVRMKGGFQHVMPPEFYALQKDATNNLSRLSSSCSDDPLRERTRVELLNMLQSSLHSASLIALAINTARTDNGWDTAANDLNSQFIGSMPNLARDKSFSEDYCSLYKASPAFSGSLPDDAKYWLDNTARPSGYTLGTAYFTSDSSFFAYVARNSFAEKLGFQIGDKLLVFGDYTLKATDSIEKLKLYIKANTGKTIRALIERHGKRQTVSMAIPSEIPSEYLIHN